jgi:hypothetical protein
MGSLTLEKLELGDSKILTSMPEWPKFPQDQKDKFDFSLFMKILGDASKVFQ